MAGGAVGHHFAAAARLVGRADADDVRDAIQSGLDDGEGVAEIARRIRKASSLTPHRAAVIARTETHQAATYAAASAADKAQEELGVRLLKVWLPTLDSRTRPDHAAMASHPAVPLEEKFLVGGVPMDRPGDPSAPAAMTVNCRCGLAFEEATEE